MNYPSVKQAGLFAGLVLCCSFLSGEAAERPGRILGQDLMKTLSAPACFDSRDWLAAGLVAGGAVTLYSLDGEIRDTVQRNRGGTTNAVENIFKSFGRVETALPAFALTYAGAAYFGNGKLKEAAGMSLESFIIAGFIFQSVKYLTHRDRPCENTSPYKWHGPGIYDQYQSFPSGDAATAFALLTPVAHVYKDTPLVAPLAYSAAAFASLGRLNHNDHWASDVFVGAALGFFTAKAVIKYRETGGDVAVIPVISADKQGVMLTGRF